jgi:hypothetical protein
MSNCGSKPKLVAVGIAPLGIVSIGVVPMGVVSIGVVPMGVLSLGVVGMGVINACVVGMGVVVAGMNAMGIWSISPGGSHRHPLGAAAQAPAITAYPSRDEALEKARALGCSGAHAMGPLWMPCAEHPADHPGHQP